MELELATGTADRLEFIRANGLYMMNYALKTADEKLYAMATTASDMMCCICAKNYTVGWFNYLDESWDVTDRHTGYQEKGTGLFHLLYVLTLMLF